MDGRGTTVSEWSDRGWMGWCRAGGCRVVWSVVVVGRVGVARKASNRRLADVMAVPTARRRRGGQAKAQGGRPLGVPRYATGTLLDSLRDLRVSKLRRSSFYRSNYHHGCTCISFPFPTSSHSPIRRSKDIHVDLQVDLM